MGIDWRRGPTAAEVLHHYGLQNGVREHAACAKPLYYFLLYGLHSGGRTVNGLPDLTEENRIAVEEIFGIGNYVDSMFTNLDQFARPIEQFMKDAEQAVKDFHNRGVLNEEESVVVFDNRPLFRDFPNLVGWRENTNIIEQCDKEIQDAGVRVPGTVWEKWFAALEVRTRTLLLDCCLFLQCTWCDM